MKKIIILILVILLVGCLKKDEQPIDLVENEPVLKVINTSDIASTDKNIILNESNLINLNYDAYNLKYKDNDLELMDFHQNNYLFEVLDTNSLSQKIPILKVILKTETKESVIENIDIDDAIIIDENSFYYFSHNEKDIYLNYYDINNQESKALDTTLAFNGIFNRPYFFRDNLGNIYFVYINRETQSFDIYQEKNKQFNKLISLISTEQDAIYYGFELIRIIDNKLYYSKGYKDRAEILSVDLATKEEKVLYTIKQNNPILHSIAIKGDDIAVSVRNKVLNNTDLYIIKGNDVQVIHDSELFNNVHFLDDGTLLFSIANIGSGGMHIYNPTDKTKKTIKINSEYLKNVFLLYEKKIIIGFDKQQRFYQFDLENLYKN